VLFTCSYTESILSSMSANLPRPPCSSAFPRSTSTLKDHKDNRQGELRRLKLGPLRADNAATNPPPRAGRADRLPNHRWLTGFPRRPMSHVNPVQKRPRGAPRVPGAERSGSSESIRTPRLRSPAGQVGELVLSGPNLMSGVLGRPARDGGAFLDAMAGRWLRTVRQCVPHGRVGLLSTFFDPAART